MRNFGASATTMRSRDVAPIAEWPRQVTRCPRPPPACSGGPHSSSGRKGRSLAASCRACQPPSALDLPAEPTSYLLLAEQLLTEPLVIADGELTLPSAASLAGLIDWRRA